MKRTQPISRTETGSTRKRMRMTMKTMRDRRGIKSTQSSILTKCSIMMKIKIDLNLAPIKREDIMLKIRIKKKMIELKPLRSDREPLAAMISSRRSTR